MKTITITTTIALTLLASSPLMAMESVTCGQTAQPLTSVADFDANGVVDRKDIRTLAKHIGKKKPYYALYDVNADGKLDRKDLRQAIGDTRKTSTKADQELATFYNRFKSLQTVRGYTELGELAYSPIPAALRGHGVHWFSNAGMASMMGHKQPDPMLAEGLNVSTDERRVHALFWASPAVPVFDNGATDYPTGENWKDGRVISFSNMPTKMTSRADEMWHKHGGLCMPLKYVYDESENRTLIGEAHQYTTYNECQAMQNDVSMLPDGSVMWANFYMLHMWLYDLNPNGFFAGRHPCVEQNAPSDETINGGREVPHFFAGH